MKTIISFILTIGLISISFCIEPKKNKEKASETEENMSINYSDVFESMCEKKGREYLDLENVLIAGGEESIRCLKSKQTHEDPFARTMADMYILWIGVEGEEYKKALDFFVTSVKNLKGTPVSNPSPTGVAYYLNKNHESRVTDMLAVRLVKCFYPVKWMASGILLYLKEQQQTSTIVCLLRYINDEPDENMCQYAVEVIKEINDPDLKDKLEKEIKYRQESNKLVSPYLKKFIRRKH